MAEHRTVDARVVGSTPISHPCFLLLLDRPFPIGAGFVLPVSRRGGLKGQDLFGQHAAVLDCVKLFRVAAMILQQFRV